MQSSFIVLGILLHATSLLADIRPILDWNELQTKGSLVTTYALQGPINNKSDLENCIDDAVEDLEYAAKNNQGVDRVVCAENQAGDFSGYVVIVYNHALGLDDQKALTTCLGEAPARLKLAAKQKKKIVGLSCLKVGPNTDPKGYQLTLLQPAPKVVPKAQDQLAIATPGF